jgi:hypothetical protein
LQNALLEILEDSAQGEPDADASDVFERLGAELRQRGFHVLDTPAPPLRDLFLWRSEEDVRYTVRLTDRSQPVQVTFISDVYSQGWKAFATLGLVATTGWVEGERLYCIGDSYDRNSEDFRVSYLKHEARHLADYQRFPGLPSADLEYRAKLTELAFASQSMRQLLKDFTLQSADNPDSPHAYANYRVSRDVQRALSDAPLPESTPAWGSVSVSAVNRAARELLEADTRALIARGE